MVPSWARGPSWPKLLGFVGSYSCRTRRDRFACASCQRMRWIAALLLVAACGTASPPPPGEDENAQTAKPECNDMYWTCYDELQAALTLDGAPDQNSPCAPW